MEALPPPPIVLAMDVRRRRCVRQIRRALSSMPGVTGVSASPETGMVVVRGDMRVDAEMLRRRLQDHMERPVTVVSDGCRHQRSHVMPCAPPPSPAAAYYLNGQHGGPPGVFDGTVPGTCTIL